MKHLQNLLRISVLATLMVFAQHAAGQSAADIATARDLFREGAQLAKEGRWTEARDRYERSLKLKRAALTLYSLGVAQRSEGRVVEALESFRGFLVEPSAPGTELYREPARDAVAELEKQVAGIVVKVHPPGIAGLRVEVDGVEVPLIALDRPRLVNPGPHKVVVSAPAYRPSEATAALAEGKHTTVELTLEPIPVEKNLPRVEMAGHAPPAAASRPPAPSQGQSHRTASWVCLGGGAALSGAGLGVGLAGLQTASEASTNDSPEADRARAMALAGDIMGGVGIGVAGAGLVLFFVKSGASKTSDASVSPFGQGNVAGVRIRF